jgi:hypothetical protein
MATLPSRTLRALTPDQRAALFGLWPAVAFGLLGALWLIVITFPAWIIACAINQGLCWQ